MKPAFPSWGNIHITVSALKMLLWVLLFMLMLSATGDFQKLWIKMKENCSLPFVSLNLVRTNKVPLDSK